MSDNGLYPQDTLLKHLARACLASVMSIYYRVPSDRPSDATWDLLDVSLLTLVELFIGIVVSCMPSFLKVLQHRFSVFDNLRSVFYNCVRSLRASLSLSRNASNGKTPVSKGPPSPSSSKGLWPRATRDETRRFNLWRFQRSAAENYNSQYSGCPSVANVAMRRQDEIGSMTPLYGLRQPSTIKTSVAIGYQTPDAGADRIVMIRDINQQWNAPGSRGVSRAGSS